jgi:tetratricopeptide (TPR) repeat protein
MKKISTTFLAAGLLMITGIRAQTIAEGVNDLYAERMKGAKAVFEKLLAANPNNIDATYWLGQTHIAMNDIPGARNVYSKSLMASANAPLILVGMGQVELNEKKISEATQRFETAITLTHTKKGDDPGILNAVGRAIVNTYTDKEKIGDINYALGKLEAASVRDPNNAEIFMNLGTAYLKANPGFGGGKAFENYKKANTANPNFAAPYFRLGKLFESQKNWELYEQYMNDAIAKDPRFAPAYYELYYYKLGRSDFPAAQDMASKYIANSDPDPQVDHFKAQTSWAEKKYDEAINISKGIIARAGDQTKARTYILLADSYLSKGDTSTAKQYIDIYFSKAKPEEITSVHLKIKGDIYLATPGQEEGALSAYLEAVKADTVLTSKIDLLKKLSATFKGRKLYDKQVIVEQMILDMKPNLTLTDYFNATLAYYFDSSYEKSRELSLKLIEKFPAEIYGYQWAFNSSRAVDTVKKDSVAVPDATKLFEFTQKDSIKYKSLYITSSIFLVDYYVNFAKDAVKALEYIKRAVAMDPTNENYKKIMEQIEKSVKPSNPRGSNESKSSSSGTGGIRINNKKAKTV